MPLASGVVLAPCHRFPSTSSHCNVGPRHAQGPQITQGRSHQAVRREQLEGPTATGETASRPMRFPLIWARSSDLILGRVLVFVRWETRWINTHRALERAWHVIITT